MKKSYAFAFNLKPKNKPNIFSKENKEIKLYYEILINTFSFYICKLILL